MPKIAAPKRQVGNLIIVREYDGPWSAIDDASNAIAIHDAAGEKIADFVNDTEDLTKQDYKLAAAMVAAPELLAALSFCRSVIHANGVVETSERLAIDYADQALRKARAVLNNS